MPAQSAAKTYLLLHGACHGGWCWKEVATGLRALGHTAYTPTFTGLGERSHLIGSRPTVETWIEDACQVIRFEDLDDVIVVGHSFGGSVVSGLADRMRDRLRHLVYLDAMVLQHGQSALDTTGAELINGYRDRAMERDGVRVVPPSPPAYFGVVDPELGEWLKRKLTPHPLDTYFEPLKLAHPVGNGLPVTYITCAEPLRASTASSRAYASTRGDWTRLEMATGHNAMTLIPDELTALLANIE